MEHISTLICKFHTGCLYICLLRTAHLCIGWQSVVVCLFGVQRYIKNTYSVVHNHNNFREIDI